MPNKAVFLDRDGVINVDKDYVFKIEDLEFIPGTVEALRALKDKGFLLIVITNQSGIGRGYYSEQDYLRFREELHKRLSQKGIIIDAEYFCKHSPEEDCDCRKPNTFMIDLAIRENDIDIEKSFMVGDKTSDIKAGKDAGLTTILVRTGKAGNDNKYDVKPDHICADLKEALDIIG